MTFHAEYLLALSMGFIGSLHCLGMCGPIALIVPSAFKGSWGRALSGLIYNTGRGVTYAMMGMILGGLELSFSLFKWQQGLSIAAGIFMIIAALIPNSLNYLGNTRVTASFLNKVKQWMSAFLGKKTPAGIFGIGIVNGLLPCGLVYVALAGSLSLPGVGESAAFMFLFGLGTFPMMSGIHLIGDGITIKFRKRLSRFVPYFIALLGVVFILRGMGLGIPYLSPSMDPHSGDKHCTMPSHRHF